MWREKVDEAFLLNLNMQNIVQWYLIFDPKMALLHHKEHDRLTFILGYPGVMHFVSLHVIHFVSPS